MANPAAEDIRAAGAVLWRPAGGGTQVALIHRPKYDDWSFAKGKVDPGEHVLLAAVREVAEETGLHVTLGRPLPEVRYLVDGYPKRVDYWAAQVDSSASPFTPNSEVDRLDWVATSRASGSLSHDHDVKLVTDLVAGPLVTVPIILVRHASAGSKSDWHKDDALRPLDSHGKQQAKMLAKLLCCFGAGRVISSPAERCLATVRPYAECVSAEIEVEPAFGMPDESGKKAERAARTEELGKSAAAAAAAAATDDRPVVICAHRENMPLLVSAVCEELHAAAPEGAPLRKAGFWVLHRAGRQLAASEQHHPEDLRLPAVESAARLTAAGMPGRCADHSLAGAGSGRR